ncbi:TonB-dependent receptor [Komagataeibacter diospyri]|uniref:TonB-dependent outer membrane receptor n=1 Tax=Komagataeibacter diospyri TaxID=1932662 RepID=A0A4P5P7B1_9PROT|nr:TonB-dependent receptor [Komagataeibacter diospyri]GCE84341.1 TonB-dependent outer membrane receptor [Komagataeibacter diospyri]GCE91179.1 TonB-dependent outer membrane receptor [Komagataeibacter diospyri]
MKTGRDFYSAVKRQVRVAGGRAGLAGLRMPGLKTRLRAMSCLVGTVCIATGADAWAQTATPTTPAQHRHVTPGHVAAAQPKTATPAQPAGIVDQQGPETIRVASSRQARDGGGGMMRLETAPHAVQTIGKQFIEMRNPTSTALDLVKNLPSMNVTTPDPSGMEGGQIQTRGLTDLDMGLMLDGAPAAAAKYLNEDIDSENLESVEVTPGSSATDLPAMSAAGGVMNERSHTASHKFGGMTDFSYGTNNMSREFIRLESGDIGKTGIRSYFSFSNTHSRSWMGSGINQRKHIDFGLQKDWDNGSNARLFVSWNSEDFTIDAYPDSTAFYNYKHTGTGYGRNSDPTSDNYWKNNNDHWNQIFLTAPIHVVLPAKFAFDLQPYFSFGQGWDASPGNNTLYGQNWSASENRNYTSYFLENEARQVGAVAKVSYDIDRHNHLSFGYWYENNQTIQNYPTGYTMANGAAPSPNWQQYQGTAANGYGITGVNAGYELHSLFIQDTAKYFNDKLQIHAGFKFVMSDAWNKGWAANSDARKWVYGQNGQQTGHNGANTTEPLPQLSISYTFNDHHQIYVNAEGDYRQPSATDLGWLSPTTGSPMLKNQYSIKEELGYRYHDKYVMLDLSLFNYNVTNRILSTYLGANQYMPIEGGNQTMRGFDVMIASRPFHGFSPYASFEYLHATQDSNVVDSNPFDASYGKTIAAKGQQAIMAPHVMANFGLTYKYRGFFANAAVHYTGPQSVALDNSERMPGYVTDTLSLGYHFKPFMYAKSPSFKLNFSNLTGSIVRTGAMGAIYHAGSQSGSYPVFYGASSPTGRAADGNSFMVEPRFTMTGTISTSF